MKKLMIFAAAAALLVACEKPNNGPEKNPDTVTIDGVTYKTVTLANGQTWMAENLRFIPEGEKVSENPAEGNIWYPADPGKGAALKDETAVKKMGLLYNHNIALGIDAAKIDALVKANDAEGLEAYLKSFEGVQGICPEGWHIPTAVEYTNVFGKGIGNIETVTSAPFYDKDMESGNLKTANAAGYNFQLTGTIFKANFSVPASYNKNVIKDNPNAGWNGKNGLTYSISSSLYKVNTDKAGAVKNAQFYGLMSNFAKNFAENGALALSYNAIGNGCTVRCVKNN